MKRPGLATIAGAAAGVAGAVAARALRKLKQWGPGEVTHLAADRLDFKEVLPGVSRAVLWGDPDKGAYGAFTRFAPGVEHPLHKHTNDLTLIVLSGAYLYRTDEGERRIEARSYFFLPGGTPHRSAGDATDGCLFYEESLGPFDLVTLG